MDIATLAGIIAGTSFIIIGILLSGNLSNFYDAPSIMIVIGGTLASTLIAYPLSKVIGIINVARNLFFAKDMNSQYVITRIIELANIARKEGLLALEEAANNLNDPFLQKGVLLVVDGTDPELVKNIMETEISFIEERHRQGQGIFETMGSLAPAFGMIGTLIGLINMLMALDDPDALGPNMSIALVTTFYGSVMANLLFIPMASKLKQRSGQELLYKGIMLEGLLSIQAGENPRLIEEKLKAFLSPAERKKENDKNSDGGN
ncbi:MAG: Chemotaxis protein PomA [candidate division WS2 bacterium]|nr:Chemotaxis protein PomA [Candidatus Psychracetigena formicireducens]